MNWEKTFEKIERGFGFKLYDWQKDYISMKIDFIPVGGRCNGKTFAYVVRHLLNYEVKIGDYKHVFGYIDQTGHQWWMRFPRDEFRDHKYMNHWYPQYVIDIDKKLKSIGLDTCFL